MGHHLETLSVCDRVRAGVGFKIGDYYVESPLSCGVGILKHLKGLANAGCIAKINL
jgi:hypothetical protein